ncbi:MAG: FMN-binding protein [Spirochaetaceae bacterium]|jgi:fumarate reductase flavoprotein subunit|nr:FMN-binding protein [Spirochaetaceae bacterium]
MKKEIEFLFQILTGWITVQELINRRIIYFTVLFVSGCMTLNFPARFTPGVYGGEADGYYGKIVVAVETDAVSIVNIDIVDEHEDDLIGFEAMRQLCERILDEDSTDIDGVSGATISSEAFLDAVNSALRKAKIKNTAVMQNDQHRAE